MYINGVSYDIVIGYKSAGDPKKDTVKYRTFMDGELSILDYGARKERIAEFKIINLTNAQFIALEDYLIENAGEKIYIAKEDGENLFPDVSGGGDSDIEYYVYLLGSSSTQEEDFAITNSNRGMFTITVRVALAGPLSSSVPNVSGDQNLDILIKIDTTLADYIEDDSPGPSNPSEGERWLDITSEPGTLKRYNGSAWVELYTIVADDVSDLGLYRGSFYLSSFADLDYNLNSGLDTAERSFKSGMLNYKSIKPPNQSIDISKGPDIARRQGFTFSLDNADQFWDTIVTDKINLFGSKITIWIYDNDIVSAGEGVTQIARGINKTNDFTYTDYKFKVEPFFLDDRGMFPAETIVSEAGGRYEDIKADEANKHVFMTYGQHRYALLQNISTDNQLVQVTRGLPNGIPGAAKEYPVVVGSLQAGRLTIKVNLDPTDSSANNYTFNSSTLTAISNGFIHTIKILGDTNSSTGNAGEVRKVESITSDATDYTITLNEALPIANSGTDDLTFVLYKVRYRFQIEGAVDSDGNVRDCGGFGSIDADGDFIDKIDLYLVADSGKKLITLPSTEYSVSSDGTIITLNPIGATDASSINTFKEIIDEGKPMEYNFLAPLFSYNVDFNSYILPAINPPSGFQGTFSKPILYHLKISERAAWQALESEQFHFKRNETGDTFYRTVLKKYEQIVEPTYSKISGRFAVGKNIYLQANTMLQTFSFPVTHTPDEADYLNSSEVRLAIRMRIRSQFVMHRTFSYPIPEENIRECPAPFKLIMRMKKYGDDTYITDSDWTLDFSGNQLSMDDGNYIEKDGRSQNFGVVTIDNRPNVDNGFREESNTIIQGYDYQITFIVSEQGRLGNNTYTDGAMDGDYAWNRGSGGTPGTVGLYKRTSGSWVLVDIPGNLEGKVLLYRTNLGALRPSSLVKSGGSLRINFPASYDVRNISTLGYVEVTGAYFDGNNGTFPITAYSSGAGGNIVVTNANAHDEGTPPYYTHELRAGQTVTMFVVDSSDPEGIIEASEDVDYTSNPIQRGRDLFDVSSVFGDTPQWQDVEQIEFFVVSGTLNDSTFMPWIQNQIVSAMNWLVDTTIEGNTPSLYVLDQVQAIDKPLFASVQGRKITDSGTEAFTENAELITEDILNILYPNKYDTSAVDTLMAGKRADWKFKRQFTSAMKTQDALKELLVNLWAAAVFDENDNIVIKTMDTDGANSSSLTLLSESNILQDSISPVKFRNSGDIYQEFILNYDYNIPSEIANALPAYNKTTKVNEDEVTNGDESLKILVNRSRDLYNLKNTKNINFKYHKELNFADWVINFYGFNAWGFKVKVELEKVLGTTPIELMDLVRFKTSFHTNDTEVIAFIVGIKPMLYDGIAELTLYIINPPGKFGALCDPFNDALNLETRDISGWTDANGQINDAGRINTRSGVTEKDAGRINTRTFSC